MQLTTKGRYAITAMLDLAANNAGKPITLDFISQRQNISLSYLEQLFAKLRRADLVKSVRGPGGGYLLNTQAKNISLTQIIEAVDENIDLRRCKGVCNRIENKNIFSQGKFDISMLDNLKSYIDKQKSDVLVVLHSLK
jgi:Rrf2 family iron-sulfur cluster assembly transcriptional regulator